MQTSAPLFPTKWPAALLLLALLPAPSLSAAQAVAADGFRVEAEGPARVFLPAEGDEADPAIEASAVAPIGDGRLWLVAHDKAPGLVVVDSETGRRVGEPLTAEGFPANGSLDGPKWEGMALDDEGNYYVIGSHSGKAEEWEARSFLFRFRLKGEGTPDSPVAIDSNSVARLHVADALAECLTRLGLDPAAVEKRKVEGLAARTIYDTLGRHQRQLIIGLREPDDCVRTFVADLLQARAGARLRLSPLFAFDPGDIGGVPLTLTSLEYSRALGGFLANTATEDDDNAFHGNVLWFVPDAQACASADPATIAEARPARLLDFESTMKAEGLAVLPGEPGKPVRLAVVFDNDPLRTRIPSHLQVLRLTPAIPGR